MRVLCLSLRSTIPELRLAGLGRARKTDCSGVLTNAMSEGSEEELFRRIRTTVTAELFPDSNPVGYSLLACSLAAE